MHRAQLPTKRPWPALRRIVQLCTMHLLLCLFVACSGDTENFRLEGKFQNFNQGEFYIYGLDKGVNRKDTIRLSEGRFAYEIPLRDSVMLSVVFPNYSEIPVFAYPGGKVSMEGDASHLKEVAVKGSEDNELLTRFRLNANDQTPPEVEKAVQAFVKEHPLSPVSRYLTDKYFLLKPNADYRQAQQLVNLMSDADPTNDALHRQKAELAKLVSVSENGKLPSFSAVTIDGRRVSEADLKAEVNVVLVWASWNFDTLTMQRQLKRQQKTYGNRLAVVGVCLDGSLKDCREAMKRDSISWPTVCDGRMWQSPVVSALGITDIPSNFVITSSGKIVARNLSVTALREKVEALLP